MKADFSSASALARRHRASYTGWYKELVTELPRIENGEAYAMNGPGLGTALLPGLKRRPDVTVQRSELHH